MTMEQAIQMALSWNLTEDQDHYPALRSRWAGWEQNS